MEKLLGILTKVLHGLFYNNVDFQRKAIWCPILLIEKKAGISPQFSYMLQKLSVIGIGHRNLNYKIIFISVHKGVCRTTYI